MVAAVENKPFMDFGAPGASTGVAPCFPAGGKECQGDVSCKVRVRAYPLYPRFNARDRVSCSASFSLVYSSSEMRFCRWSVSS